MASAVVGGGDFDYYFKFVDAVFFLADVLIASFVILFSCTSIIVFLEQFASSELY